MAEVGYIRLRLTSRHCRAIRSVESRSSHRLRMRCELEPLLHIVPLHDPCSEMPTAVAHQSRGEARRADAPSLAFSCGGGRRRGARTYKVAALAAPPDQVRGRQRGARRRARFRRVSGARTYKVAALAAPPDQVR